ncbi:hypothetical protein [Streptomyces sp. R33]|uniref:Uncharacterized protein n=1 Tax=Streptomyces sp. R33 TaxID=3238629 RepID=A0AB39YGC4_9ACTN
MGATLLVAPDGAEAELRGLADLLDQHRVTVMHFVPSLLREFIAEGGSAALAPLRHPPHGGNGSRATCLEVRIPVELRTGPGEPVPAPLSGDGAWSGPLLEEGAAGYAGSANPS